MEDYQKEKAETYPKSKSLQPPLTFAAGDSWLMGKEYRVE